MNLNKNISVWRGDTTPPTEYHLWIKDDEEFYIYLDNQWQKLQKPKLVSQASDGLMSKEDKVKLDQQEDFNTWVINKFQSLEQITPDVNEILEQVNGNENTEGEL